MPRPYQPRHLLNAHAPRQRCALLRGYGCPGDFRRAYYRRLATDGRTASRPAHQGFDAAQSITEPRGASVTPPLHGERRRSVGTRLRRLILPAERAEYASA